MTQRCCRRCWPAWSSRGSARPPAHTLTALPGDEAYCARAHREHLRSRGVTSVIPEPSDQLADRKRRGSADGRSVDVDTVAYERRNVVERCFNRSKNWRALATRYDCEDEVVSHRV